MTEAAIPLAWPEVGDEELEALREVLESRRLSVGTQLRDFEIEMAALCACADGVGVNSGTMGLQFVLQALGIAAGDEVLAPSYTFVGTANAIWHSGARPVFVDVDPQTLNIDANLLEAAIGPRTRAIMVVHLFGRAADMDAIQTVAQRHHLAVIEDACEAGGGLYKGHPLGGLSTAGVFGFYPNKPIATGEGGMIVSDDAELLAVCRRLRNQGTDPVDGSWEHQRPGYSARLSELHAALGRIQLRRLDADLQRRSEVAGLYRQRLADDPRFELPAAEAADGRIAWFTWPLRIRGLKREQRDRLIVTLRAQGIGCAPYFVPVHQLPFWRDQALRQPLPVTEDIGQRCIGLPLFAAMQPEQVDRVCETLSKALTDLH